MRANRFLVLAMAAALISVQGFAVQGKAGQPAKGQGPKGQGQATQAPGRIVLGTNQMAGDDGKLGLTYTIGKQNPMNVTLTGAEFTVERFNCGGYALAPGKDEKLLILSYTVHNPNKEITHYDSGTLKFTTVDQEDVNHEGSNLVTRREGTDALSFDLKPAQKIECRTAIIVPAKGTVPKLIVAHASGGAVLRYDLRPILKPLAAPFAGEGMDALSEIKANVGEYMPLMYYSAKYLSNGFQESRFGPTTIGDDKVFFLPKFTVKKQTTTGHILRFKCLAITEDGDRYEAWSIAKASVDEHAASNMEPGQETSIRMVIQVPKKAKIKEVRFWEEQEKPSRVYIYSVDACYQPAPSGGSAPSGATTAPVTTGIPADDYATVFKDAKGGTAMEVLHSQTRDSKEKRTEITVKGHKAILVEDLSSGATTLYLPDRKETLVAPKAQGKEPVTTLDYYEMAYANSVAPKPKKRNLLGSIGKAVLGQAASGLGESLISGAVLSSFGQASMPSLVSAAVQTAQGYAVRDFASQLGRAVMTSSMTDDASAPERVHSDVRVDKSVYVETNFKTRKQVPADAFAFDATGAKQVDAETLYKAFAEFMGQGIAGN